MFEVLNPLYEDLKMEIKRYEIREQLAFDQTLQELRQDKSSNIENKHGIVLEICILIMMISTVDESSLLQTLETFWLQNILTTIK